jgi:glycosyltransferase involved in cell wall biosynthesis
MTAKILFVTTRFPYPVIGGERLRIHQLASALAETCELSLLSLCQTRDELSEPADSSVFSHVHKVWLHPYVSVFQAGVSLLGRTPLQLAYYRSRAMERLVERLLPEHDLVVAHLIRAAQYVPVHMRDRAVLEMTDAISMNYDRVRKSDAKGIRRHIFALEYPRLAAYELAVARSFRQSILVSDVDRRYLEAVAGERLQRVVVAGNGVDLGRLAFRGPEKNSATAVFIGNMTSLQNQDAVRYFAEHIAPLVRARIPGFRFRAVGNVPDRFARELATKWGVEFTGRVESVAEAASGAFCGVCPVRLGAGVQNKVLEYMALGLPVVCSEVGLEGLCCTPGEHLLVGVGAEEFAESVYALYSDFEMAKRIGVAGHAFVRDRMSWKSQLAPALDAISRLLKCQTSRAENRVETLETECA